MKEYIPFAHAVSECEPTSVTYHFEKLRVFKKLNESTSKNIYIIGNEDAQKFYGNLSSQTKSLDDLLENVYALLRYILTLCISPIARC